jgi:hypothetical protein
MKTLIARQEFCKIVVFVTAAAVAGEANLLGQSFETSTAAVRPAPDQHTVYHLFFGNHARIRQQIEAIRSSNPQQASALDASLAAQYNITVAELAPLSIAIAATSLQLDAIEAEAKALFAATRLLNKTPDQKVLDALNSKRYLTVIAGIVSAKKTLSPTSWINIRGYINNEFRNTTQVIHR